MIRLRRPKSQPAPPAEYIYVSDTKLASQLAHYGIAAADTATTFGASGSSPPPLKAKVRFTSQRTSSTTELDLLEQLATAARRRVATTLDDDGAELREGEWFWFHRELRFGFAHADSDHEATSFLLVDSFPMQRAGVVPGLLMHGSWQHTRNSMFIENPTGFPLQRSGSQTTVVFKWTKRAAELEQGVADGLGPWSPDYDDHAISMYDLFADPSRVKFGMPHLLGKRPCEGLATVTKIAVNENGESVVFASPLFVRAAVLPANRL